MRPSAEHENDDDDDDVDDNDHDDHADGDGDEDGDDDVAKSLFLSPLLSQQGWVWCLNYRPQPSNACVVSSSIPGGVRQKRFEPRATTVIGVNMQQSTALLKHNRNTLETHYSNWC